MKKKFKLKKKVLGFSLAALLVGLPFTTNKVETVKADNCETYNNDYVFLDTGGYDYLRNATEDKVRSTFSYFSTEMPDGYTPDSIVSAGWIMSDGRINDSLNYWTEQRIASDIIRNWASNINKNDPDKVSSTHWIYYHGTEWGDEDTKIISDANDDPSNYAVSDIVSSIFIPTNSDGVVKLEDDLNARYTLGQQYFEGKIKRVYNKSRANQFGETLAGMGSGGSHPTGGHWYAPAVYRITYKICSGGNPNPPVDGNVKLTIHHYIENTTTSIDRDITKEFEPNSNYNERCKSISGYTNVNSSVSGTIGDSDKEEICYYKQDSTPDETVTLTINYLDKKGNVLKNKVTKTYNKGETVSTGCDDKVKSNNVMYVFDSYTLNGSGKSTNLNNLTLNNNTVLNCVYTSESVGTADLPIFIVWAVGGGALAYSIYFFRKYYKEQNEV